MEKLMVRLIEGIGLKEQQVLAGLFAGFLFYLRELDFICEFSFLFASFPIYLRVCILQLPCSLL
ncbi:hypothetical protein ACQCVH_10305 [Bacillus infantis]|uniref:hypothetical protein n=1 Tax=Bacillus infantis TaxID=324767 RepID=UPI003CECE39B